MAARSSVVVTTCSFPRAVANAGSNSRSRIEKILRDMNMSFLERMGPVRPDVERQFQELAPVRAGRRFLAAQLSREQQELARREGQKAERAAQGMLPAPWIRDVAAHSGVETAGELVVD